MIDLEQPLSDETERDQVETGFTPHLRELLLDPRVLCAIFVDREGESVDYCARVDMYEAKIAGAQLHVTMVELRERVAPMLVGEVLSFLIAGEARDFVVRRVDGEYSLVVVTQPGAATDDILRGLDTLAAAFRDEAGLVPPWWDRTVGDLAVETRPAVGWSFAPTRIHHAGHETEIHDVIGRWTEQGGLPGGELECFRVRLDGDRELTLAWDAELGCWLPI